MNLLPEQYQKDLRLEVWRRYIAALGPYVVVVLIVGIGLLLPSFFFLQLQISGWKQELNAKTGETNPEYKDYQLGIEKVREVNAMFRAFVGAQEKHKSIYSIIQEIAARTNSGVVLSTFSYSTAQSGLREIRLSGTAATRDDLLTFLDDLKASPLIAKVDAPLSDAIRRENTPVSVTITLK